jgi:dedicated sortase system histidine kinase
MANSRHGLSIRTKLLLVALALLLIPWMGYQYVREMKSFLLQGQGNALSLTARAVSTVLHDRPEFFDPDTGASKLIGDPNDMFAYPLPNYVRLDGRLGDWGEQLDQAVTYDGADRLLCGPEYDPYSLSFRHLIGYRGPYLYAFFEVTDDKVVPRNLKRRRLDASDHLRVAMQDPGGPVKRYLLTLRQPGRMSVYLADADWRLSLTGDPNYDIAAEFLPTDDGYVVELRIPRFMVSSQTRLGFSVADVDDEQEPKVDLILNASQDVAEEPLNRLLIHSPEIAKILRGLDRPVARIWVLDDKQRVRAVVGKLSREPEHKTAPESLGDKLGVWYDWALRSVYNLILETPAGQIQDVSTDVSHRNDEIFKKALSGSPQTERRPSLDGTTQILMAAHPVWSGDEILGVVVVEQSSNEVLFPQKQVLENVISVTLLVLITVTGALLVFASRITMRIRRLRNAAEQAIGPDGRVCADRITEEAKSGDEIGDLSRSVTGMLGRLGAYTRYLEGMPDTLAHELSNPLNVVNSSLDNLQDEIPQTQQSKYMQRAKNGIIRLGSILTNLTEAANLEEAMQAESREEFDLVHLVSSYVEGYRLSHPDRAFQLDVRAAPLRISGTPDHIAQMLDKLADNAVDFGNQGTPIMVRLDRVDGYANLSVVNEGSNLPVAMRDRLFDPMVSIGKKNAQQSRLGLGLYIVRLIAEFHRGKVQAVNRDDRPGAVFTVSLPLAKAA